MRISEVSANPKRLNYSALDFLVFNNIFFLLIGMKLEINSSTSKIYPEDIIYPREIIYFKTVQKFKYQDVYFSVIYNNEKLRET